MSEQTALALLKSARADGAIGAKTLAVLDVDDLGARIQAGFGIDVDDVSASEVMLVSLLLDDSGSIRFGQNAEAVRSGANAVVDALAGSAQRESILMSCRYLNGTVLYPFRKVESAERLTRQNYDPSGTTPLYDQTVVTLGTVLAKAQAFIAAGVPCRTTTLIVSDGADCGSMLQTPAAVHKIVSDMLRVETHLVAAMGIDDGQTDFRAVFRSMGIDDNWILTPGSTPSEIRRAFQLFSQSAVRASQSAAAFSKASIGGFGG